MAFEVKVPAVGESVQEGEIYKWHKKNGDAVEVDDVLLELETDKATVEVVAEAAGILEISVPEGETVGVGDVIAKIDKGTAAKKGKASSKDIDASSSKKVKEASEDYEKDDIDKILSPAARRLAEEKGIDVSKVKGSGRGGRISKEDILSFSLEKVVPARKKPTKGGPSSPKKSVTTEAREIEPPKPHKDSFFGAANRSQRREKMSRLRQKIAKRLVAAQQQAAMLTTFNEVDMTAVLQMRKLYKEGFKDTHGVGLGFMSFFVSASAKALEVFPEINGYIDGEDIIFNSYVDIGVAVSTDKGLMVPVLRNCSELSFQAIEANIVDLSTRGRNGKITVDDLTGGTFTISNGGVFGSLMSTPILNPPQSAILGMHKIQERAMVIDGEVVVRPMMYLALSYDHRIVDGKEAVSFLVKIKDFIEDPVRLLLGV